MAEQANNAPAEVSKPTETATPAEGQQSEVAEEANKPKAATAPAESETGATIGEVMPSEPKVEESRKKEDAPPKGYVPEAVFLELKNDLKDLKKSMKETKPSNSEVSQSLAELGAKYDVDPDFLTELASSIRKDTESEFTKRLEQELEPYKKTTEAARKSEVDKVFSEHYEKTLEAMPEYKDIASKEVIKALALDPKNADKTFGQILESAYGHLVTGKSTLDESKPGSGKTITDIDYDRARRDTEYFNQIMANPALKKKYNDQIQSRLQL